MPLLAMAHYRYLRFFCDSSVVLLTTTAEPVNVLEHLTWETVASLGGRRGRWRLGGVRDTFMPMGANIYILVPGSDPDDRDGKNESRFVVEIEGNLPSCVDRLELNMHSSDP